MTATRADLMSPDVVAWTPLFTTLSQSCPGCLLTQGMKANGTQDAMSLRQSSGLLCQAMMPRSAATCHWDGRVCLGGGRQRKRKHDQEPDLEVVSQPTEGTCSQICLETLTTHESESSGTPGSAWTLASGMNNGKVTL